MSVVVNHLGVRLELDPKVISDKMIENIRTGKYENAEAREINRIIQPGEVVVEIGAGIGFISTLIAKHDNTVRVVSYEANPKLIGHIVKTLENNTDKTRKNWEIRNAILKNGSEEESVDFYVHNDFWASSLLPIKDAASIEQVKVENFNQMLRDIKPTMIVCDIEGGELDLFKNADPRGSLAANVGSATVRSLSNMPLAELLEDRHRMSRTVRLPLLPTLEGATEAAIDAALKHAGLLN